MDGVRGPLLLDRVAIASGVGHCGVGAYHDFTMVKGNDVSRAFDTHEIDVNLRNCRIAHDCDYDLGQIAQGEVAVIGDLAADRKGCFGDAPEPGRVQPDAPLAID